MISIESPSGQLFDTIVIGSGVGGLSTASILAKEGQKVLVLEQHYEIGGFSHSFSRPPYRFDVGLHYVGDVHVPGSDLNRVFRYITNGNLKWEPMDDVYDKAFFGDAEFEFVRGEDRFKAKLKEYFADKRDSESIDRYFSLLHEVGQLHSGYFAEKALPPLLAGLLGPFLRRSLLKYSDRTTLSVLKEITDNTKLIGVLTAQYGDYGLTPSKSSFYMHALVANHYMNGAAYPVGGAASLAKCIAPVIQASGGDVLPRNDVKTILTDGTQATGVSLENGRMFYARNIVSDTGIVNTFRHLLSNDIQERFHLKERLSGLAPATAHIALYVGVRHSSKEMKFPKTNYWVFPNEYDHEKSQAAFVNSASPLPVLFISFPSAKDPDWEGKHPRTSTIELVTLAPYEWFSKWQATSRGARGKDYEDLKESLSQRFLEVLFKIKPQLKDKIDFYELSTPLSTSDFMHHKFGEMYGLAHSPARFRNRHLRAHTPVKNLFLSGQDILTGSVGAAAVSGVICASAIRRKNLFRKILESDISKHSNQKSHRESL